MAEQKESKLLTDLMCGFPVYITYSSNTHIGFIRMPSGSCADMAGAIQLFTTIDPNVRAIVTMSGDKYDTQYQRDDSGWYVANQ